MSFLLKRKLGEQEDGEDSDHGGRWCNEGDEVDERGEGSEEDQGNEGDKVDEVRHRPLSRLLSNLHPSWLGCVWVILLLAATHKYIL